MGKRETNSFQGMQKGSLRDRNEGNEWQMRGGAQKTRLRVPCALTAHVIDQLAVSAGWIHGFSNELPPISIITIIRSSRFDLTSGS